MLPPGPNNRDGLLPYMVDPETLEALGIVPPPPPQQPLPPPLPPAPVAPPPSAPVASAPAQARPLPEPIPLPERRSMQTGSRGGRIAHGVFGGLLSGLTGGGSDAGFRRRMNRADALSERDYSDQKDAYALKAQERKQQEMLQPIPAEIAQGLGLPPGTTYKDAMVAQQGGMTGLIRQKRGIDATAERDAQRQADRLAQDEARSGLRLGELDRGHGNRMDEIRLQGSFKKKRGGGGGGGNPERGQNVDAAIDEAAAGYLSGPAIRKMARDARTTEGRGHFNAVYGMAKTNAKRVERYEKDFADFYEGNADMLNGIRDWKQYVTANRGELDGHVATIRAQGLATLPADHPAREMVRQMRPALAAFLRKMAGAAMSPQEASLHAGPAGDFLIDSKDSWVSLDGMSAKLEGYLRRQGASIEDIFASMRRISSEADTKFNDNLAGAPVLALRRIPERDRRRAADSILQSRWGSLKLPPGAKPQRGSARLEGHRLLFTYIVDGEPMEGELK